MFLSRRRVFPSRYRTQRLILIALIIATLFALFSNLPSQRSRHTSSYFRFRDSATFDDFDWNDPDYSHLLSRSRSENLNKNKIPLLAKIRQKYGTALAKTDRISTPASTADGRLAAWRRAFSRKAGPSLRSPRHTLRSDGLLEVNPNGPHPIYQLIQHSEELWKAKLDRTSKTLRDAVVQYKKRYGRSPPKGFDKWWDYVVKHKVQLPDEYDQIYRDIEPFWALRPSDIKARQETWETFPGTYTISNEDGFIYLALHTMPEGDEDVAETRASDQIKLLREVQQWLPDFRATFTAHDVPYQFIGHDQLSEAREAAGMGEYLDSHEIFDVANIGWASACSPASPLRSADHETLPDLDELWNATKTFIWDHKLSMNPCIHPTHAQLNGFLKAHGRGPSPRDTMVPAFSMCTTQLHADILTVAVEMWTDDVGPDPEWKDKPDDRLLWRGSNTGMYFDFDNGWNVSQRVRLVKTANEQTGKVRVLKPIDKPSEAVGDPELIEQADLNDLFMDIAFSRSPLQCREEICKQVAQEYEFREAQTWIQANEYKYILDVDGNGWSARFKRLMTSNSLILKSTIFPEWYTDRVQPWVHFVPIKNDLTDLYDVMTFFRGDPSGAGGHDEIAEMIATQGKQWSNTFWRKPDMIAYMFRLFLEYARVSNPNREHMDFELPA